jgi:hypothetical protein
MLLAQIKPGINHNSGMCFLECDEKGGSLHEGPI